MSMLPAWRDSFGALLRRYRLNAGLTQERLAERARLSVEALSALERGARRTPRKQTLALLIDALHLTNAERDALEGAAGRERAPVQAPLRQPAIASSMPRVRLVGRAAELALLDRYLAGEGPALLLFAGEPGIGKTALLREARQRALAQGWTVLEGGCHRRSGQEPYAPLLAALDGRLRQTPQALLRADLEGCAWLARLLPEIAEVTPTLVPSWILPAEQERRLMFLAVARFLANVAGPAGTLLLLDDLHWAGQDALDLLTSLLRPPGARPLRILGAFRSTETSPTSLLGALLTDLAVAGLAAQQMVGPLTPSEARETLDAALEGASDLDAAARDALVARTGGVPFFLVSCAQARRLGTLPANDGGAPWTVAQSIRQRIAALPPHASEALGAAAVIGRATEGRFLAQVVAAMSVSQMDIISALEALDTARLLIEGENGIYRFPHDLIWEVTLADLSAARRARLHELVAEALEHAQHETPIEQLADHYLQAGNVEKALIYLQQAANRARDHYAYTRVEEYERMLIERLDTLGRRAEAAQACERLGEALFIRSRHEQALEALEWAFAGYRALGDREALARVTARIGWAHTYLGTLTEGLARVSALTQEDTASKLSPQALAYLYDALAQLYQGSADYAGQMKTAKRACVYAAEAQDARMLARNQAAVGIAAAFLNRRDEADSWLNAALPALHASGDLWALFQVMRRMTWLCLDWGDITEAQDYGAQALDIAKQVDNPALQAEALYFQALSAYVTGEWEQSLTRVETALSLSDQPDTRALRSQTRIVQGMIAIYRGQAVGERLLDEARVMGVSPYMERWIALILSERDILLGLPARAAARLEPLLADSAIQEPAILGILGWASIERSPERAADLIERCVTQARSARMLPSLIDGLRIRALLAIHQREWEVAGQTLKEALQLARATHAPYNEAKALYVSGLLGQAQDKPEQATARLKEALTILHRLGERLYANRAKRALAKLHG